MTIRSVRWYRLESSHRATPRAFARRLAVEAFGQERDSGFIVDQLRKEYAVARFVERKHVVDTVSSPFGDSTDYSRVVFNQTKFSYGENAPEIELVDAVRLSTELVGAFERIFESTVAISKVTIDVMGGIRAIERSVGRVAVTILDVGKISIADDVTSRIRFAGARDVRREVKRFLSGREVPVLRARISWRDGKSVRRCDVSRNGVAFPLDADEVMRPIVRHMIMDHLKSRS